MAMIRKRRGRWEVNIRIKGSPAIYETFSRRKAAERWAAKMEGDIRDGRRVPDRTTRTRTFAELVDRYRLDVLPSYSRREQGQRVGKLGWWLENLGDVRLISITPPMIEEHRAALARGKGLSGKPLSAGTQVRYLALLKHVLTYGLRWGMLETNPAAGGAVQTPKEPSGRLRYLKHEEIKDLLVACRKSRDPRLYTLVSLAVLTGARQGELLRLQWRDLDLDRGRAVVERSKNGDRRALQLPIRAVEVLRDFAGSRRFGVDLVFCSRRRAASFPDSAWHTAKAEAEIKEFRFHDLRHTFASHLAMSGATLMQLAEALGHKSLAMVRRYAHLCEEHTAEVVGRMAAGMPV
jgi:integrase